ncbi:hypothetical protein KUTeg_021637 [Tegillarca granosa]|uniref:UMOD/GP2/OIT3-like D8C domain-containing protein n=1 Tax=Tegillarca granosa TaxID=220873 RepID=A0ABQ9EA00_TEGGR|nr:hypothetical protein KUTeg_021637 [Tegillarca granosa]
MVLNEPHRSTQFQLATGDAFICDHALPIGWYKFNGGDQMPTSCVPLNHCGTQSPIWFKGQHPTQRNVVVQGMGCINLGFNTLFQPSCCQEMVGIRVMNCGNFYIYHLGRTPGLISENK